MNEKYMLSILKIMEGEEVSIIKYTGDNRFYLTGTLKVFSNGFIIIKDDDNYIRGDLDKVLAVNSKEKFISM